MIIQMLRRKVLSEKRVAHVCQILCSVTGGLVMVLGFRRIAELDLTEAQLFSAVTGTLCLTGVFIILAFLLRGWQKRA